MLCITWQELQCFCVCLTCNSHFGKLNFACAFNWVLYRYDSKLLISESRRASYIVIDKERCKACHYCIAVCPRELIAVSEDLNSFGFNFAETKTEREHECTGCQSCAIMCPDSAISVYRNRILEAETIS